MRITVILFFLLSITCFTTFVSFGQTIAKFRINMPGDINQFRIAKKEQQIKDTLAGFNCHINELKQKNIPDRLGKLVVLSNQLNNSFLKKVNKQVAALAIDMDSVRNGDKKEPSHLDTILVNDSTISEAMTKVANSTNNATTDTSNKKLADTTTQPNSDSAAGCSDIFASISQMVEEKQDDGSYLFSIVNKKGEALNTFTIQQFDEALFDKKTTDAIYGLCNGSLTDDDKLMAQNAIDQIKKTNLYQRFLEASLAVDNNQDIAGVLSIYKKINLYRDLTAKQKKAAKRAAKKVGKATQTLTDSEPNNKSAVLSSVTKQKSTWLFSNATYTEHQENSNQTGQIINIAYHRDTINASPAGQVSILKPIHISQKNIGIFTAYKIQIQFQDGFIENIKVEGKKTGDSHLLKFENIYPIPFSTKNNYKTLFDTKIFEKTVFRDSNYCLMVGELLYYSENFALESKDYSPANKTTENLQLKDDVTEMTLYKEQTSKIMEAKAFSDLKGVNSGNPNGLVQFEVSKKLNFWSQRLRVFNSKNINWGLFNYIVPTLSINKIESNEKRLVVNSINNAAPQNNHNIPLTYASTIDIFSHQNFTLGFDLSAILVDDQAIKSTFNFGPFFYYGNVPMQDTLRSKITNSNGTFNFTPTDNNNVNNYDINTFYWGAFANWQIFPNPKYGVAITGRIMDFKAMSHKFLQVKDSINYETFISNQKGDDSKYGNYAYRKTLISTEIFAFFKPSDNNKLFFRYRYTKDMNDPKTPYRQIQIGYATYLTKTKEVRGKNTSPVTP